MRKRGWPVDHIEHPQLNVPDFFDNVSVYIVLGLPNPDVWLQNV